MKPVTQNFQTITDSKTPVFCLSCKQKLTQEEIARQLKVVGEDDIDLALCDECELTNYCIHLQTHDF
jgi:hypothetical protein